MYFLLPSVHIPCPLQSAIEQLRDSQVSPIHGDSHEHAPLSHDP